MSGFSIAVDPAFQNESIYNLVPRPVVKVNKPPMYKSRHDPLAPVTVSTLKNKGPNLGFAKVDVDPGKYLKKSTPTKRVPLAALDGAPKFSYNSVDEVGGRKPSVPTKDDKPITGIKSCKNFITANAVDVILKVPIITRAEETDYLSKPDYGKIPSYLSLVKAEIVAENELIDDFVQKKMQTLEDSPTLCDELDEEERQEIIVKLKAKWDAVNKKYQVLCMHTIFEGGKKAFKEALEKELNLLEADLSKMLTKGPVVISADA